MCYNKQVEGGLAEALRQGAGTSIPDKNEKEGGLRTRFFFVGFLQKMNFVRPCLLVFSSNILQITPLL